MAFSLLVSSKDEEIFKDDYVFGLTDFNLLGFEISEDKEKVTFYYIMMAKLNSDEGPQILAVSSSYKIGSEKDIEYLKSNSKLDFAVMRSSEQINSVPLFIDEQKKQGKLLYTNFIAISETELHNVLVEVIGTDNTKGITFSAKLEMPLSMYTKISLIKAEITNHLPINFLIDKDDRIDNLELHDNCELEYFGADYNRLSDGIVAFYTIKSGDKKIAIISAVPSIEGKIITKQSVDLEQVKSIFGTEVYGIDMRNVFLFEIMKSEALPDNKICLLMRDRKGNINLYRFTCGYDDCVLFHPYDFVY